MIVESENQDWIVDQKNIRARGIPVHAHAKGYPRMTLAQSGDRSFPTIGVRPPSEALVSERKGPRSFGAVVKPLSFCAALLLGKIGGRQSGESWCGGRACRIYTARNAGGLDYWEVYGDEVRLRVLLTRPPVDSSFSES